MNPNQQALISKTLQQAVEHHLSGQLSQADLLYQQLLDLSPNHPDALHLLGVVKHQFGQHEMALGLINRAIKSTPSAQMYCNLGTVQKAIGKLEDSIDNFRQAIKLHPQYAEAYYNLAISLKGLNRLEEAVQCYRKAIELRPDYAEAFINLGVALLEQNQPEPAIECYKNALRINNNNTEAHNNLGNALLTQHRMDEALVSYQKALTLSPQSHEAINNIALVYQIQGKVDLAIKNYRHALELKPDYADAHSNLIFSMDMYLDSDIPILQQERKHWGQLHANKLLNSTPHPNTRNPFKKLRIGYVSGDFKQHSAAFVFSAMLTSFDREQFEVYAYSNSSVIDYATTHLQYHVKHWRNIVGMSDDDIAQLIRTDGIDILVDLSGHSCGNRLLVFARKPAPIQITAWGYIGGTGMQAMDYFFADEILVPPEEKHLYAEEVRYLPTVACYYAFDAFPAVNALPALAGRGVTFGSFNRLAKITEASFRLWAQVLLAVPHSRMVLKTAELDDPASRTRVMEAFVGAGVSSDRITLLGKSLWSEHMVAFNQVDVALDPFPHGGGVTAYEGIMMGVPMVTLRCPTIPGRISAAILTPLGLADWVAESPEEYVSIAVKKTRDLAALAVLRRQLRKTMTSSLLGNPEAYARVVEQEYRILWQRWCEL